MFPPADRTHAASGGSDETLSPSAGVSGADESVSDNQSPDFERMAGSMLAMSNTSILSDDPAEAFQQMVDKHLAGSSGAMSTPDNTLSCGEEPLASGAERDHNPASPAQPSRGPSPLIEPSDDEDSPLASSSSGEGPRRQTKLPEAVPIQEGEPLAAYNCPICFSAPTNATITPCGHILCGECLFTAVKTSIQRAAYTLPHGEHMIARFVSL
ncbi:hypothetical protein L227DRAFT_135866 [Lentinus tigrinus ALCF2SS1-6]|uniref:RING-type domain-containing protein n=1 Tax=Lentinus tigrinus ALCF2SS1-6 TaxID=1328759 RepID=A0A5C2SRA0_9APHY|nr:hypothetical protein L227DRAFT_135866 [Lentinus tigrinus ALCF2SS1-6]